MTVYKALNKFCANISEYPKTPIKFLDNSNRYAVGFLIKMCGKGGEK